MKNQMEFEFAEASPPDIRGCTAKSLELQALMRANGYGKGDGVGNGGIGLVARIARSAKIRGWPDTRHVADYDALISAVQKHFDTP
jgi:hypothetical protein